MSPGNEKGGGPEMVHQRVSNGATDTAGHEAQELHFEVGSDAPRVVVVGLDASQLGSAGSHSSLHAASYAAGLARREGGRLIAIWVRPRLPLAARFAETVETLAHERDDREAEIRRAVEDAADHFGIPATSFLVLEGDPFEELTAAADKAAADLIVVGASEQRLGSLAARLIRDGRWPVTVVP